MIHAFISYAREDRDCAQRVAKVLEARGMSVWWDRTILAGERFEAEIQQALDSAGCVVVLWSETSVGSDWVKDEAEDGKRRHILVPALIDDTRIPLGFRSIQTESLVDWRGESTHDGIQRLASAVAATLERERLGKNAAEGVETKSETERLPASEEKEVLLGLTLEERPVPEGEDPLAQHLQAALGNDVIVLKRLGAGRIGVVYLAEQVDLSRYVVVKVLKPRYLRNPRIVARFKREAHAMAGCPHPGIVPIYQLAHAADGLPFFKMEYIAGTTLEHRLERQGKLRLPEVIRIITRVAEALTYAHKRGLVHRDVNPTDILLEAESGRVLITDFGLAALATSERWAATTTGSGQVMGTPAYVSPEQARHGEYGAASDQYSLAVISFEMLAGRHPFPGPAPADYVRQHAEDTPPFLLELEPQAPSDVAKSIQRALSKDPQERFESAVAFAEALQGAASLEAHAVEEAITEPLDRNELADSATRAAHRAEAAAMAGAPDESKSALGLFGRPVIAIPLLSRSWAHYLTSTRKGLITILAAFFTFNWMETVLEAWLTNEYGLGLLMRQQSSLALSWFEFNLSFEYHDLTNAIATYGYTAAYFFVFPLLILGLGIALAQRDDIAPFRVFTFSVAIDYLISLPFFLFFPVPERWSTPGTGAMLLSDRWTSNLIEAIRPISGLDNCFPSNHTSLTVIVILLCYIYYTRLRLSVLALGLTVILSTFVLGIHWIADIITGVAVGLLSVHLARRLDRGVRLNRGGPAPAYT